MQILEHPDITRALRTGYPNKKTASATINTYDLSDDEFLRIMERRKADEKNKILLKH